MNQQLTFDTAFSELKKLVNQIEDDEITEAVQYLYSNSTTQSNITVRSKSGDYELIYSIKKID